MRILLRSSRRRLSRDLPPSSMSLNHHFGIVRADISNYFQWKAWEPLSFEQMVSLIAAPVRLHDDIVRYILDSLNWIPSYNPSKRERHTGLNLYGITLISSEGAHRTAQIFRAWGALFSMGPEELDLTGGWTCLERPKEEGRYQTIRSNRDSLVKSLQSISMQCDETAVSEHKAFVLHLGI